jgi:hypothetical protein
MAILGSAMLLFHSNDAACDTTYSLRIFQILSPPGTPSVIQQSTASPPLALSYSSRRLFNMLPESEFLPHLRLRLRGGRVSLSFLLISYFWGARGLCSCFVCKSLCKLFSFTLCLLVCKQEVHTTNQCHGT